MFFKGLLPRDIMFVEMSKYDIGLLPWKRHWSHPYLNPNKYAEYAHSGLLIINSSSLRLPLLNMKDNISFLTWQMRTDFSVLS